MQDHEVTRLLVDARHTEPMPEEVVERLDGVLASLAAERRTPAAPVVDLAARRRTRRVRMLVAAAAVVAAGVALPSYLPQLTTGSDDASSSESADSAGSAASGDSGSDGTAPADRPTPTADQDLQAPAQPGAESETTEQLDGALQYSALESVRIRPEHFSTDVLRATSLAPTAAQRSDKASPRDLSRRLATLPDAVTDCVPQDLSGRVYLASYGGRPGVLLVGPRVDGERRFELFMCGDPQFSRAVVLPAD